MLDWLFSKKKPGIEPDKKQIDLMNEIDRLKGEYKSISNNTTDIHESLHRFELIQEIVRLADGLGVAIGNTYSGEVICDYQHAVHQISERLWAIRFSGKG